MNNSNASKKLTASLVILIILSFCLCVTTFALSYSILTVETNIFSSGYISINLNDGKPVIEEDEFAFEPGMTVEKSFFLKNNSSCDVYYKLYFEKIEGELAKALTISIKKGEKVLYEGSVLDINKNVLAADDELAIGERRELTITFHFPSSLGNSLQDQELTFDLRADAVQTKNNPQKLFD